MKKILKRMKNKTRMFPDFSLTNSVFFFSLLVITGERRLENKGNNLLCLLQQFL